MGKTSLIKIDQVIAQKMRSIGVPAMRISFGIIFIWFGVLKPFGLSAAQGLLESTVAWLPFGEPKFWLMTIGWWEVAIEPLNILKLLFYIM